METVVKRANEIIDRWLNENGVVPESMGKSELDELANIAMTIATNEYKLGFIK